MTDDHRPPPAPPKLRRGVGINFFRMTKLLIITQKVDIHDRGVLGFMHGWIEEFAKHCEQVVVICLERGKHKFPGNVKILSLGKEEFSRFPKHFHWLRRLVALIRFYSQIIKERRNYNKVLVHMNPEYIVLGGWLWKIWGKKIGLWYAHGYIPVSLRIAEKFCDIIFTSTKSGCRLKSKKIQVVGQGIDVNKFQMMNSEFRMTNNYFKIVTVGRISPAKDLETLILAAEILVKDGQKVKVDIIGDIGLAKQKKYLKDLKAEVKEKKLEGMVNFIGGVDYKEIAGHLNSADLFVNTSQTGSLDKAIAEAMACGLPILTCNEALEEILGEYKDKLMYPKKDYKELAKRIKYIINLEKGEKEKIGRNLRQIIVENHSLKRFVEKILSLLNN